METLLSFLAIFFVAAVGIRAESGTLMNNMADKIMEEVKGKFEFVSLPIITGKFNALGTTVGIRLKGGKVGRLATAYRGGDIYMTKNGSNSYILTGTLGVDDFQVSFQESDLQINGVISILSGGMQCGKMSAKGALLIVDHGSKCDVSVVSASLADENLSKCTFNSHLSNQAPGVFEKGAKAIIWWYKKAIIKHVNRMLPRVLENTGKEVKDMMCPIVRG